MALDLTATNPFLPLGNRILYLATISFFRSSGISHSSNMALISSDAAIRLSSEVLSMPSRALSIFAIMSLLWMK